MRLLLLLPAAMVLASGCERSPTAGTGTTAANEPSESVEEAATLSGADAYKLACAQCHDEGLSGAPKIDDEDAWAGRSWLWEAVLFEHAKNGYNDMPAKGGYSTLPDGVVEKAADYMLSRTSNLPSSD